MILKIGTQLIRAESVTGVDPVFADNQGAIFTAAVPHYFSGQDAEDLRLVASNLETAKALFGDRPCFPFDVAFSSFFDVNQVAAKLREQESLR